MDEQIELEKSEFKTKRFKELGFHPQKEIPANRLLPVVNFIFFDCLCNFHFPIATSIPLQYADQLDNESNEMLLSIKNHLAKTVALRDFKPGVTLVLQKLS